MIDFPDIDALWDFDHLEETERRFQDLVDETKNNSDPSHQIQLLSQIARAQGLQKKIELAKQTLSKAQALLIEPTHSVQVISKIRYLIENGRIFILEKTPSQARPLFIEAWTLATQIHEDYYSIDSAQMLASIEPQKLQKEWTLKALHLAETSLQPRAKQCLSGLCTTLGWTQFENRQYETALENFRKALNCLNPAGDSALNPYPKKVIVAKWAIAKTLRALNRLPEALEMQTDLVNELTQMNSKDGYVYEELAECLQSLKRTSEAQVYFDLAYNSLSKDEWLTDNKPERLKRLKSLGKVK